MHFYESSIITTKDGLHCQVYANEHPVNSILVKPKYIPTDKIESSALQYRFIAGRKMNRLNLWADKEALKNYIEDFKQKYPHYILPHNKLFFSIPIDQIERVYFPRTGLKELMAMPVVALDEHLKNVHSFVSFLAQSGVKASDLGITYSTLMGHYNSQVSDINIVVYGKQNFWNLMKYLETAQHSSLRWKTESDWLEYYTKRNRFAVFGKDSFLKSSMRKKSEGYFNNTLFVIFAAEKEEEVHTKWGTEKVEDCGVATVEGTVIDDFHSVVRPGYYGVDTRAHTKENTKENNSIDGNDGKDIPVSSIVFYSRDYCMLVQKGEKIQACGNLERVTTTDGRVHYRVVVGYFDSYLDDRREKEFVRLVE